MIGVPDAMGPMKSPLVKVIRAYTGSIRVRVGQFRLLKMDQRTMGQRFITDSGITPETPWHLSC